MQCDGRFKLTMSQLHEKYQFLIVTTYWLFYSLTVRVYKESLKLTTETISIYFNVIMCWQFKGNYHNVSTGPHT